MGARSPQPVTSMTGGRMEGPAVMPQVSDEIPMPPPKQEPFVQPPPPQISGHGTIMGSSAPAAPATPPAPQAPPPMTMQQPPMMPMQGGFGGGFRPMPMMGGFGGFNPYGGFGGGFNRGYGGGYGGGCGH